MPLRVADDRAALRVVLVDGHDQLALARVDAYHVQLLERRAALTFELVDREAAARRHLASLRLSPLGHGALQPRAHAVGGERPVEAVALAELGRPEVENLREELGLLAGHVRLGPALALGGLGRGVQVHSARLGLAALGRLLGVLRIAQTEQPAQRLLVELDVARHERAPQREEGERRPPRRLALRGHEVHRPQEAVRTGLDVVLDRLVVPVADGGVDAEPLPLGGDPRAALLGARGGFDGGRSRSSATCMSARRLARRCPS